MKLDLKIYLKGFWNGKDIDKLNFIYFISLFVYTMGDQEIRDKIAYLEFRRDKIKHDIMGLLVTGSFSLILVVFQLGKENPDPLVTLILLFGFLIPLVFIVFNEIWGNARVCKKIEKLYGLLIKNPK